MCISSNKCCRAAAAIWYARVQEDVLARPPVSEDVLNRAELLSAKAAALGAVHVVYAVYQVV